MREYVGSCIRCGKGVYCTGGFLNGVVLENGKLVCFVCERQQKVDRNVQEPPANDECDR